MKSGFKCTKTVRFSFLFCIFAPRNKKNGATKVIVVVNKGDLPEDLCNALLEVKESMEGKKKLLSWEELVSELDD